ncbi:hypothetical protein C8J57DRAFT_1732799 [Mycena rebaudengoi]|nr:hypothetical protein C8J57DRAFT_1732799 [Mycena rebaudengoi]
MEAIAEGRHRAIVTNIETIMKPGGDWESLWANKVFASKVISIVWDEAQCDIPILHYLGDLLPMSYKRYGQFSAWTESKTEIFTRLNDRSNIHLTVRKMKYPINSFKDLRFLIPPNWDGTTPLPWEIRDFFDSITESIAAAQYLRGLKPDSDADSDAESEADNAETLEERRQAYLKDKVVLPTKKTRKRKDGNELSPEMDDMINAGSEHRCIKCF